MSADQTILRHTATNPTTLGCPLCDHTVDMPPVPVSDAIGEALGISGQTLATVHAEQVAKRAASSMREHLDKHPVEDWLTRLVVLHPAESIALTAALGPIQRGEAPPENTALMCALGLARIAGRYDWIEAQR